MTRTVGSTRMPGRAPSLPADQRREALIEATIEAIQRYDAKPSTRQIAESAGVAEGTIFRVFRNKEELFDAVIERVLDPRPFLEGIAAIDTELPLEARLTAYVTLAQRRMAGFCTTMAALGVTGPPEGHRAHRSPAALETNHRIAALIAPDADQLTISAVELVRRLRLLAFAGSHPHLTDNEPLSPAEIVDTVLYGALKRENN